MCFHLYEILFFFATPRDLGELSSRTRDGIRAPLQWKRGVLIPGLPGKPLYEILEMARLWTWRWGQWLQGFWKWW